MEARSTGVVFAGVRAGAEGTDVDAFYVAIAVPERGNLSFRYLYDGGEEMEPEESAMAGTLGGLAVESDKPILLRDAERDRVRLKLPPRSAWGKVIERSIIVAPLRLHGKAIGAISAQSSRANAYDEGSRAAVASKEAAIASERADLTNATSRVARIFDLHRIGPTRDTHGDESARPRARDSVQEMMQAAVACISTPAAIARVRGDERAPGAMCDVTRAARDRELLEAGTPMRSR